MNNANMTVAAPIAPVSKPLARRLEKACYALLVAGALVFAFGLSLGLVEHANAGAVFFLLSVATLVFALVVLVLLKPGAFAFICDDTKTPQAAGESALAQELVTANHSSAVALPQPEAGPNRPTEPEVQASPAANGAAKVLASADLKILMNTTLGDVLLAAIRSDPEGAGRMVDQAINRAKVTVSPPADLQSREPAPL